MHAVFWYLDFTHRLWCTVTFLNEIVHKNYISTYVYSYPIIYKKAPGSSFPSNAACNYYISISASFWQQYVVSQGTDWIESSFGLIKGITFLLYREEKAFFFPLLRLLSGKEKSSFLAWSINVTYKVEFQSLVWFNISALQACPIIGKTGELKMVDELYFACIILCRYYCFKLRNQISGFVVLKCGKEG